MRGNKGERFASISTIKTTLVFISFCLLFFSQFLSFRFRVFFSLFFTLIFSLSFDLHCGKSYKSCYSFLPPFRVIRNWFIVLFAFYVIWLICLAEEDVTCFMIEVILIKFYVCLVILVRLSKSKKNCSLFSLMNEKQMHNFTSMKSNYVRMGIML